MLETLKCLVSLSLLLQSYTITNLATFRVTIPDFFTLSPPDSVGRASTFGAGGRGFESQPHHTKVVKMVLTAPC